MTPGPPLGLRLASSEPGLKGPISDPFFFNGGNKPFGEVIINPQPFMSPLYVTVQAVTQCTETRSGQRFGPAALLLSNVKTSNMYGAYLVG